MAAFLGGAVLGAAAGAFASNELRDDPQHKFAEYANNFCLVNEHSDFATNLSKEECDKVAPKLCGDGNGKYTPSCRAINAIDKTLANAPEGFTNMLHCDFPTKAPLAKPLMFAPQCPTSN